jgi:hypothetical protein
LFFNYTPLLQKSTCKILTSKICKKTVYKNAKHEKYEIKIIKVLLVERQKPHKKQFVPQKPATSCCMLHARMHSPNMKR